MTLPFEDDESDVHWFVIPTNPEPWKVGTAFISRGGGKIHAGISPDAQLVAFKEAVREHLLPGLLWPKGTKLKVTAWFWRQRAEYETHQARTHRKHEIDATNAFKALEDAFQKWGYDNDRDNLDIRSVMVTQDPDVEHPKIVVKIEPYRGFDPREIPDHVWKQMDNVS